jgi:hypothetical protein
LLKTLLEFGEFPPWKRPTRLLVNLRRAAKRVDGLFVFVSEALNYPRIIVEGQRHSRGTYLFVPDQPLSKCPFI